MAILSKEQKRDFSSIHPTSKDNHLRMVTLLREGEITACTLLPRGTNYVFLLSLRDDGNTMQAVYKPRQGEAPLYDFPDGTLYLREKAAYLISHALGWDFVPPTEIRQGPYGIGVVQEFIATKYSGGYYNLVRKYTREFKRIATFDWLVNNADRKAGHCLLGEDGCLWCIDHGLTFNVVPKLRTVIWDFSGESIPKDIVTDLVNLKKQLDSKNNLTWLLSRLLTTNEIFALEKRLHMILHRPVFPVWTGSYRSIPWPPY